MYQNNYPDQNNAYDNTLGQAQYEMAQAAVVTSFFNRVYGMMISGLLVTAGVAWGVSQSEAAMNLIYSTPNNFILFGFLILLSFGLQWKLASIPSGLGVILFYFYAALEGAALSGILVLYDLGSVIAPAFLVCAVMFGGLTIFGLTTKKNLTAIGTGAYMLILGVFVMTLMNIFFIHSEGLDLLISYAFVVLISVITAYDTQRLRQYALGQDPHTNSARQKEEESRMAVYGALHLYLDFIILLIYLIRIIAAATRD